MLWVSPLVATLSDKFYTMQNQFQFPTEEVTLPSKGLLYPKESLLSSGKVEMKYMTAKEEDILTNTNYIQDGTVVDRVLRSLIISKINYDELLVGDKNAILVAARILGYGKDYEFEYAGEKEVIDLTLLDNKPLHQDIEKASENAFNFTLPTSGTVITFKLLTHGDEQKVDQEVKGLKKINKQSSAELSTRLKHMIISVNGDDSKKAVREFVDKYFLARDSRALREHIKEIQPDMNLTFDFYPEDGGDTQEDVKIPIGVTFFWPDA